jgi:hypothetical protein
MVNSIMDKLQDQQDVHRLRASDAIADYLHTCPGWQLFIMVLVLLLILFRLSLLVLTTLIVGLILYRVMTVSIGPVDGADPPTAGVGGGGGGGAPTSSPTPKT